MNESRCVSVRAGIDDEGDVRPTRTGSTFVAVATIAPPEATAPARRSPSVRRPGRSLVVAVLLAAVLVVAGVALALRLSGGAPGPLPSALGNTEDRAVPSSILDIPLVDQQGRTTSLSAFRGKVVVLASFLTSCQETCPITTGAFLEMEHALDAAGVGQKVVLLEVSVDPGRDVASRLAAYARLVGSNWPLLTGTAGDLSSLWHYFGIWYEKVPEDNPPGIDWQTGEPYTYDVNHSDGFVLLDAHLHERFVTGAMPNVGGELPPTLSSLLDQQGRHNLADPGQGSWTVPDGLQGVGWLLGKSIPESS